MSRSMTYLSTASSSCQGGSAVVLFPCRWPLACAPPERKSTEHGDLPQSRHAVDGEIEDVEIAQTPARGALRVGRRERAVQDERHAAFRETAVGAQPLPGERRKVVRGGRGADAG